MRRKTIKKIFTFSDNLIENTICVNTTPNKTKIKIVYLVDKNTPPMENTMKYLQSSAMHTMVMLFREIEVNDPFYSIYAIAIMPEMLLNDVYVCELISLLSNG